MTIGLLQLRQLATKHDLYFAFEEGELLNELVKYSRELIALAQEVKPLKWIEHPEAWYAVTPLGTYRILPKEFDFKVLFDTDDGNSEIVSLRVSGLEEAKAAALADFDRRIKECLR